MPIGVPLTEAEKREIARLIGTGLTRAEVVRRTGRSFTVVKRALAYPGPPKACGVKRGTVGRPKEAEAASSADLRAAGLREEPHLVACPATVVTKRGREVCPACGGRAYLRPERARRRA